MERFLNMIQEPYFELPSGYFEGKSVLDAGCGDTAKLLIRFHDFGAKKLFGIDIGDDFIPVATKNLGKYGVPDDAFELRSGSVDSLPYEDESFDFVCCHRVLLHLADMQQAKVAFSELARVVKPGGYVYTVFGLHGGLFEAIYPAVREFYKTNSDFKELIDNIEPKDF
jgi:ubiquinone/menaquinone biosynthesis C-methylase UbiE